jgi:hypothetical protein
MKPRRFGRSALVLVLAIGLLLFPAYFWTAYLQRFVVATEPDAVRDVGLVRVESSFTTRDLDKGASAALTVTIINRSSQELVAPWVSIETPGFLIKSKPVLRKPIASGASDLAVFNMVAGAGEGQFRSRVRAGWQSGSDRVEIALSPPALVIRGRMAHFAWVGVALQGIAKDLALPIIVVILAALFKRAEEHDSRLKETWTSLLDKHHENARLYYAPLLSSIAEFRRDYGNYAKTNTPEDRRRAFYFFIVFLWRARRVFNNIGGFYFKNENGEQVLATSWNLVAQRSDAAFGGRTFRDAAIDKLSSSDLAPGYARYQSRLSDTYPFADMEELFGEWHSTVPSRKQGDKFPRTKFSLEEITGLLGLFTSVAMLELNRAYEYWYGRRSAFPREDIEEFTRTNLFWDNDLKELRKHLRVYLDEITPEYGMRELEWHEP